MDNMAEMEKCFERRDWIKHGICSKMMAP